MAEKTSEELVNGIAKDLNAIKTENLERIESVKKEVSEKVENVSKSIEGLTSKLEKMKMGANVPLNKQQDFTNKLNDFISKNLDEIKRIKSAGSGMVEFNYNKAVGSITTGSGTLATPPSLVGTDLSPLTRVNLRNLNIQALTTNINTNVASYPYTEAEPKDGAPAFTAEGGAYPQIDMKWETNFANPVKVTAYERLTEESIQDVAGLQSIANQYLKDKHDLVKNKAFLTGTGTSNQPKGATTYGSIFDATGFEDSVKDADFRDVLIACKKRIYLTHNFEDEMPAVANIAVINPIDFYTEIESAKDSWGRPLYGDVAIDGSIQIGGLTVIQEETIPVGKILVCDMSKYNTTNYQGYTVKIGYVNDDLIKGQFVITGTSRFHAFVKKHDELAFLYDDIKTIKDAITV